MRSSFLPVTGTFSLDFMLKCVQVYGKNGGHFA
jgi:hypothetical protein